MRDLEFAHFLRTRWTCRAFASSRKKAMDFKTEINDQILIALRRSVRAIDQHSRRLAQDFDLTVGLLREHSGYPGDPIRQGFTGSERPGW